MDSTSPRTFYSQRNRLKRSLFGWKCTRLYGPLVSENHVLTSSKPSPLWIKVSLVRPMTTGSNLLSLFSLGNTNPNCRVITAVDALYSDGIKEGVPTCERLRSSVWKRVVSVWRSDSRRKQVLTAQSVLLSFISCLCLWFLFAAIGVERNFISLWGRLWTRTHTCAPADNYWNLRGEKWQYLCYQERKSKR